MVKKKETEQPEVVQEQVEKPKPKKATKPKAEVKEPAKKTKKAAEPKAEETAKPKADEKAAVGISLIFKAPDLPTPAVEPKRGKRAQAQPAETWPHRPAETASSPRCCRGCAAHFASPACSWPSPRACG